jgi:cytochrome c oxidase assembly factor CtaG
MNESQAIQSILDDWSLPIPLTCGIAFFALLYLLGWLRIRRTRPEQFPLWRLYSFEAGMAVLWASIGSPMDGFSDALLSAHMVEHLLLMSVVPPLVLLGAPVVPLLRGLPHWSVRYVLGPVMRVGWLRGLWRFLLRPAPAWLLMNITLLGWHVPAAYDFALENETWHDVEHLCFLFTALMFWWVLLRPWPAEPRLRRWIMIPYLVSADLVNTALSAFLAFVGHPVYNFYITHPNPFGVSLTDDQTTGAVVMWVFGSMVFLLPAMVITMQMLQRKPKRIRSA